MWQSREGRERQTRVWEGLEWKGRGRNEPEGTEKRSTFMIKSCWHTFYSHTYTIITLYSFLVLIINEERMIGLCNDNSVPLRPNFTVP